MKYRRSLCFTLALALALLSSVSHPDEEKKVAVRVPTPGYKLVTRACRSFFEAFPRGRKMVKYYDDTKATKGRRIISVPDPKPSVLENPYDPYLWPIPPNLKRGWVRRATQALPVFITEKFLGQPYEIKPIRTLELLTWGLFTEKKYGVRERPSKLLTFPVALVLGVVAWISAGAWADAKTFNHLQSQIESNAPFYNYFIENDYRFRDIHDNLKSGKLSPKDARLQSFMKVRLPYAQWFANRPFYISRSVDYLRKDLINFYLFAPFTDVVRQGVRPTEGFLVPQSSVGPLSDIQVRTLFDLADNRAIKFEYIGRIIGIPYRLEDDIDPRLFTTDLKSEILKDNSELLRMYTSHQITLEQLLYGMQETEDWMTEFQLYRALHIVRLAKKTLDGPYTSDELSPEEIQKEIKDDVLNRGRK